MVTITSFRSGGVGNFCICLCFIKIETIETDRISDLTIVIVQSVRKKKKCAQTYVFRGRDFSVSDQLDLRKISPAWVGAQHAQTRSRCAQLSRKPPKPPNPRNCKQSSRGEEHHRPIHLADADDGSLFLFVFFFWFFCSLSAGKPYLPLPLEN